MAEIDPHEDHMFNQLKDEFDRQCKLEAERDVGMSYKDIAWEVVSKLPPDEYNETDYVYRLLGVSSTFS